jgi:hypothetical protein
MGMRRPQQIGWFRPRLSTFPSSWCSYERNHLAMRTVLVLARPDRPRLVRCRAVQVKQLRYEWFGRGATPPPSRPGYMHAQGWLAFAAP